MPTVMPTCWVEVTRPVARPCSSSGTPDVTVRPYEMIAPRWHMLASETAAVASQTDQVCGVQAQQRGDQGALPGERADQRAAGAEAADDLGGVACRRPPTATPWTPKTRPVSKADRSQRLLEVQGQHEDDRRHHREGDQAAEVAPRHRAAAQHRQGHQGRRGAGLDADERGEQRRPGDQRRETSARPKPRSAAVDRA